MNDAPTNPIAFVRRFNAWRRGYQGIEQPQPYQIGQALDALCDHAERLERELAAERALADRLCACLERHAWLDGHETPNESEEALAAWKARRDQNNLEGDGPTEDERRENARAIQAMSEQERFDLMFHGPNKQKL